jgi:exodeoxyribonuclease VII large subunit
MRRKTPSATQQLLLTDALPDDTPSFWSVTEALDWLKQAIEAHPVTGQTLTVRGELSNLRPASSGHVYATLKDSGASLNVVMWRSTAQKLKFRLEDGMAVLATGQFNIYAPGGSVSMVLQNLVPDGMGALQLAFEQLKTELAAEGLFDEDRKQPLPLFPLRVGIVTSPTGAVIHDMWRVIRQKNPLVSALLVPVAVQGDGAASQIAAAIDRLNHQADNLGLDAILLARGGGSFEDLFCFSEAVVVRAIADSQLPIVTGIGHQPDFSLADAAADYSAATPTAAADMLVPDSHAWQQWLTDRQSHLHRDMTQRLATEAQRLDSLTDRLISGFSQTHTQATYTLRNLTQGLQDGAARQAQLAQQQVAQLATALHELSPLATLARGYSVASNQQGHVIQSVKQVSAADRLTLRLSDGTLTTQVISSASVD